MFNIMARLNALQIVTATLVALNLASLASADIIDGEELIDPTRPLTIMRAQSSTDDSVMDMIRNVVPSSYDVSFVRASSNSPMAVINDQRVTIGDVIGGATVVAIERNSVTLSINDEERRISVFGTSIKAPAAQ
ncbi:MAG: hypothetical protein PsegKO_15050 [Pseudohongiellaceae bacterium]